jgi:putative spermidine/putrescine transport system ATP-binding protein/spermidine/putrescine transport system ATP-binding protein
MSGSAAVELARVAKSFGGVVAVRDLDLAIADGSFVTLLGPSGCGKTTTLRMVAGLEQPSAGDIAIKGRRVNDVPIHQRNLGLVFQNFALFPHKTVFENVAYGLKFRSVGRAERDRRVRRALDIVRLPHLGDRLPAQLSGGQQQRVALARATVIEPDVLLLDEPLSSLDASLREEMRVELKTIQREIGITTIFVTHDQGEALALSDKIVVMNHGVKEQEGAPEEVYNRPATRFVAEFLGHSNFINGRLDTLESGRAALVLPSGARLRIDGHPAAGRDGLVSVVLRAEKVLVGRELAGHSDTTRLTGRVAAVDYLGTTARYFVDVAGLRLQAIALIDGRPFAEGSDVELLIRAADCISLPIID